MGRHLRKMRPLREPRDFRRMRRVTIEVGVWKADANDYRKRRGRELRIVGNFDKLVLERDDFSGVVAEFERLRPLMEDGGFIPIPDHLITPGTSLANYRRFLEYWRQIRI